MATAPVLLGALLQNALQPPTHLKPSNIDDGTWRRVVGAGVVRRAMPLRLREGVLTVRVASSAWAQQLSMLREELCERLRQNGYKVREIRFSVGPVIPPRRLVGSSIFIPYRKPVPLPPALVQALAFVPDPALRATLTRAAEANLAWQRSVTVEPPLRSELPGLLPPDRVYPERSKPSR